jgi:hypothetical protein
MLTKKRKKKVHENPIALVWGMEMNQGDLTEALGDTVYDPWETCKKGRAGELIIKQFELLIDKPTANGLEATGNAMMLTTLSADVVP